MKGLVRRLSPTALLPAALLALFACARVYDYPEAVRESGVTLCGDGVDNDFDDVLDCSDPDCIGSCPEDSAEACTDGADNDGDGLRDGADPRCWLEAAPVATRCAATSGSELVENFDAPAFSTPLSPWALYAAGNDPEGRATAVVEHSFHAHLLADGREDGLMAFSSPAVGSELSEAGLASLVRVEAFAGSLPNFELSFEAQVTPGALLRVGIAAVDEAPALAAPFSDAETKLLAVAIDARQSPPSLILTVAGTVSSAPLPASSCDSGAPCAEPMAHVEVVFEGDGFRASYRDAQATDVIVRSGPPPFSSFPPARLVLRGGSAESEGRALVDDLKLGMGPEWPCGYPVPQIVPAGCDRTGSDRAIGHGVALGRAPAGDFCALVTASDDPEGRPASISAWSSGDAVTWSRAPAPGVGVLEPPEDRELVGAGIAADDDGWHAVIALRSEKAVELGFAAAPECGSFGALDRGPELFADAEAPSLIISEGRRDVYFTRPPTDQTERTLWRLAEGETEPLLLAELPADVSPPVSVGLVGKTDLVLAYPVAAGVARSGAGLLVADASRTLWQSPVSNPVLALPQRFARNEGRTAFDDRGLAAVALGWQENSGFLLYAGLSTTSRDPTGSESSLSVGTAALEPPGTSPGRKPRVPESPCGDGTCELGEDCVTCEADCGCPGAVLLADALAEKNAWQQVSSGTDGAAAVYFRGDAAELTLTGGSSTWSGLPLTRALAGDFELAFDVFLGVFDNASGRDPANRWLPCSVFVGLGTPPPESLVPQADKSSAEGAFVELRLSRRCPHAYFAAPFALTSERALELLTPDSDDDCADERYLPPGRWQHVALRREGERVTSKVALENGCGSSEETLTLAGPLGALPELLVGFGGRYFKSCARAAGTATIRNLTLRLLDGPESCREGTHACRGEAEEPVCADLSTYPEHCGSCAHACAPNERCRGGRCVCSDSPGVLECDGACVDVQSSLQHCGGCDQDCAERCTRGVCDVIFGTCDRPYELAPEGGSFILDFSRADPIYETVACDFGLDTAVFAGEARLHHVTLVNYTPARSGNLTIQVKDVNLEAVLAANEGGDETLDTVLGLSDASQRSCFHWVNCNENGPGLIGGSRLLAPVSAGTTYRIAVGINGKPTESMTAEFEVELE